MRVLIISCLLVMLAGCNVTAPPSAQTPAPTTRSASITSPAAPTSTVVAATTAAQTTSTAPVRAINPQASDVWTQLQQRPLLLPTMQAGGPCPVTTTPGTTVSPDFGSAIGHSPVYAVGIGKQAKLYYGDVGAVNGWHPLKILWVSDRDYLGPILIRGQQLDGPHQLRFNQSDGLPEATMQLPAETRQEADGRSPSGWRHWPSYTFVEAPGCYAYQVDGADFSYPIVVQAVNAVPSAP